MADDTTVRPPPSGEHEDGHEAALVRLARVSIANGNPRRKALLEVAKIAASALKVDRVSIWRFVDAGKAIRCEFLYQPASQTVSDGMLLSARDFPNYFRALAMRRVVTVTDIDGDPCTEEFREPYFKPLGIVAMLDAPIYQGGAVVGIICHEQIAATRRWTARDCELGTAAADALGRLYEEAARRHAESLADTYQMQVLDQQRLGEMGQFAAGIAHDFNNILQVILGYADEIAVIAQGDPRITGRLDKVLKAAERGQHLMTELRTLGRDVPSRPRVIVPDQAIGQIADLLARAAGPAVSLAIACPAPVGQVFIDPTQLERAVLNLVVNARDALPSGGVVAIDVTEAVRELPGRGEGNYVVIDVRDNGVGMDAETRQRMFEPLFTTKGEAGTGLGLAIVHQVVSLAGGFIEVDSVPGSGTSARIHLPRMA